MNLGVEPSPDYAQLRTALSRAIADVGDYLDMDDTDAARDAMRRATAIEAELSGASGPQLDVLHRPAQPLVSTDERRRAADNPEPTTRPGQGDRPRHAEALAGDLWRVLWRSGRDRMLGLFNTSKEVPKERGAA